MNTTITLPDGKRIIITPKANPYIVKTVNDALRKLQREYEGKGGRYEGD